MDRFVSIAPISLLLASTSHRYNIASTRIGFAPISRRFESICIGTSTTPHELEFIRIDLAMLRIDLAPTLYRFALISIEIESQSYRDRIDSHRLRPIMHRFALVRIGCLEWHFVHIDSFHIISHHFAPTWLRFASTSHRYRIDLHRLHTDIASFHIDSYRFFDDAAWISVDAASIRIGLAPISN